MENLSSNLIALSAAALALIFSLPKVAAFFAKDKIESIKKINDLEDRTMRQWVEQKFVEVKNLVEKLELKLTLDFSKEFKEMEERIDKRLDKIEASISCNREERHDMSDRLNIKNIENQLLAERLEKSDRIIESGSLMINKLGILLNDQKA